MVRSSYEIFERNWLSDNLNLTVEVTMVSNSTTSSQRLLQQDNSTTTTTDNLAVITITSSNGISVEFRNNNPEDAKVTIEIDVLL